MTVILASLLAILSASFGVFYWRKRTERQQLQSQLDLLTELLAEEKSTEKKLQDDINQLHSQIEQAEQDPVTGLYAWHLFDDRLKQSIKDSARHEGIMAVMMIDLDNFKVINEALGNEVGDYVLKETAQRLTTCIRQVDSITRQVKDVFVVLLKQLNKSEMAALVAARMLAAVSEPFHINEHELYVTACIGIALFPADGNQAETLLRHADDALGLAKRKGKHLFQFHEPITHVNSQRELAINTQLSKETIFNELQLCYQPIMNIESQLIACMDVQLYWQSNDYGLIMPREIFSYAENQRKLNVLSEWLVKKACQQFLHWQTLGIKFEMLGLPLSIKQLENGQFIHRLSQILQELAFDPACLLIEIREKLTQVPLEQLEKALNMFKYVGVKTAIVDFDAGAFPLHYLKNLDVNYIKLSPAFVSDVVDNPKARQLLRSLVLLAKNMSMQLIVQGVESEAEISALREVGCTLVQGNLLGAPLSVREVEDKATLFTQ